MMAMRQPKSTDSWYVLLFLVLRIGARRQVRRVRLGPGLGPGACRQARWVARGSARKGGS